MLAYAFNASTNKKAGKEKGGVKGDTSQQLREQEMPEDR